MGYGAGGGVTSSTFNIVANMAARLNFLKRWECNLMRPILIIRCFLAHFVCYFFSKFASGRNSPNPAI